MHLDALEALPRFRTLRITVIGLNAIRPFRGFATLLNVLHHFAPFCY